MDDLYVRRLSENELSRRRFLGVSVVGAAVVSAGSSLAVLTQPSSARAALTNEGLLRSVDATYFSAVLPAVVVQARAEDEAAFLASFESMLSAASEHTIGAIQDLVDLLSGPLTRPLMTMAWTNWSEMSAEDVRSVLENWRDSSLGLKRTAYGLTTTLVRTAWYMQPDQQAISGYPGPPKKIVEPSS